jgi:hypothetical protein
MVRHYVVINDRSIMFTRTGKQRQRVPGEANEGPKGVLSGGKPGAACQKAKREETSAMTCKRTAMS